MSGHAVIPIPHPDLKVLSAAMKLRGPKGMCFHRSVALAMDLPSSAVVVATLRAATPEEQVGHPERSTVPFIHAWVEFQDKLMAPSTIEQMGGLVFMQPRNYYEVNGARDIRRLPRQALVNHVADNHVMRELLYGIHPGIPGYLVGRLLDAVGVKYLVSPQGGVIPLASRGEANDG
jgi:hypothetical protein